MKAVIVEKRGDYAAVLCDDGSITRIKSKNIIIGQVIEMKKGKINKKIISVVSIVAVFVMLMSSSLWAYYSPYSYVSVDGSPSIVYSVNRFDKIIDAKGMNDDGKAVLAKLNLKNKDIKIGVKETVQKIADMGYFSTASDNAIVVTTSSGNEQKADKLTQELKDNAQLAAEDKDVKAEVDSTKIGYDRVQEARKLGVTPGKLNLVQKLAESSEDPKSIVVEEWINKPVTEIMNGIKENKDKAKSSSSSKNNENEKEKPTSTGATYTNPSATPNSTSSTNPLPSINASPAPTDYKNNNGNNGNGNSHEDDD